MIYHLKHLHSRAANAENPDAQPGAGGKTRSGRKGSPCIEDMKDGATITLLDIEGPGVIRHIWCTIDPLHPSVALHRRNLILRIYWDDQPYPSVEVPIGDFFGIPHGVKRHMTSKLLSSLGGKGWNCWIPMPFQKHVTITIENDSGSEVRMLFYQIDFTAGDDLDDDTGYLHAQFRRENPCPMHQDYVILDGIQGCGVYLGTVLGVRSLYRDAWWGEGEVKFFMDGEKFPTICGTGTEDYIGFAWGLQELCDERQGCPYKDDKLGYYSIYRFHQDDPIYFYSSLKVTIQQMGFGSAENALRFYGSGFTRYEAAGMPKDSAECFFDRSDDYSSVAYWYQTLPSRPLSLLPAKGERSACLPPVQNGG